MRRVRSRLTILLLILVIVTSLFSLTFGALVRNGIIFQQRDNIRYLVFGYAAKDILLLLIAVAAVAVLITVTSRSTTNPIRELSRAAREIAGGNYDVTVPERDRVEEFGELERNFNLMTAELRSNEYLRKDFISSVSHQLKTPLSILNGYAQLLAEGGLSDTEEREYSQYIAQESDRLVGLIDDMLRLSRIDHREIQRKAEIFPLGEQLRRAVTVWDTGCGMDAETLPRIFEQFYQGETDRRADGCGLGLTLCKRIVEQHGGTISAESRPGEGSRFSVALPAKAAKFM